MRGLAYPSDLTDVQWALLEPVFITPGKRTRKHGDRLRTVVDAMLYIAQAGVSGATYPSRLGLTTAPLHRSRTHPRCLSRRVRHRMALTHRC